MSKCDYEALYREILSEQTHKEIYFKNIIEENKAAIASLEKEKKEILKELQFYKSKSQEKEHDLIFLSDQYKKLKIEFDNVKKMYDLKSDEYIIKNENELIEKLVNKEIMNIKNESFTFWKNNMSLENFTLDFIQKPIQRRATQNSLKEHKILSDNVDEILLNIQQKKEKLILTQKMMNHINI